MAITDQVWSGKLFQDDGDPVEGATVALLDTGSTTTEVSTTTDSNGAWSFTRTHAQSGTNTYDVKITSGTSVRYILWSDEITTKGIDTASLKVRGAEAGSALIYLFPDQGDDNIDHWRISAADGGTITFDNNASGSLVAQLSIAPNATATSSVVTVAGELDAASLDISGNADIDGTTNLDAVDIDGAVQLDATLTVGVDDQGYDVKLFGDTASAYLLWDTSADKLLTAGGAVIDIVKDKLLIGGTAVTTTAAELNVLDAVSAGTVAASKAVVVDGNKDIGSFRNVTLTGELDAATLDISGNGDVAGAFSIGGVAILAQGTTGAVGAVELATSAEITTGTSESLVMTPGLYSDSRYGIRYIQVMVFDGATDIAEGDNKAYVDIPAGLNGMDLVEVRMMVVTAGNGSTVDVQLAKNGTADMLSTSLTIDSTETDTIDAATPAVIKSDGTEAVATGNFIAIDVDGNGGDTTIAKGLIVTMGFRIP